MSLPTIAASTRPIVPSRTTRWKPSTTDERAAFAGQLESDVQELYDYVHSAEFQTALESQGIAGLSNGAIALLDEVATGYQRDGVPFIGLRDGQVYLVDGDQAGIL